ncbi:hypothetical protein F443_21087 [Phytophthora nicotianae P1569]|uniref:Uncharacterized protein n=1 Tax=Phytophthora nicotianae P1569 TaxID=1317065 RepID=V9DYR0_PHYNI|nr:hypothetical protein F443_21087 [Phytophthora nicotianae P1569]
MLFADLFLLLTLGPNEGFSDKRRKKWWGFSGVYGTRWLCILRALRSVVDDIYNKVYYCFGPLVTSFWCLECIRQLIRSVPVSLSALLHIGWLWFGCVMCCCGVFLESAPRVYCKFLPCIFQVSGSAMEWLMTGASSVQMVLEVQRNCCEKLHMVTVSCSSKGLPFDCVSECSHDACNKGSSLSVGRCRS